MPPPKPSIVSFRDRGAAERVLAGYQALGNWVDLEIRAEPLPADPSTILHTLYGYGPYGPPKKKK